MFYTISKKIEDENLYLAMSDGFYKWKNDPNHATVIKFGTERTAGIKARQIEKNYGVFFDDILNGVISPLLINK
jgi:hypothetical protein